MKDFFPEIFASQFLSVGNDKANQGRAIQDLGQKSSYTSLRQKLSRIGLEARIKPFMK